MKPSIRQVQQLSLYVGKKVLFPGSRTAIDASEPKYRVLFEKYKAQQATPSSSSTHLPQIGIVSPKPLVTNNNNSSSSNGNINNNSGSSKGQPADPLLRLDQSVHIARLVHAWRNAVSLANEAPKPDHASAEALLRYNPIRFLSDVLKLESDASPFSSSSFSLPPPPPPLPASPALNTASKGDSQEATTAATETPATTTETATTTPEAVTATPQGLRKDRRHSGVVIPGIGTKSWIFKKEKRADGSMVMETEWKGEDTGTLAQVVEVGEAATGNLYVVLEGVRRFKVLSPTRTVFGYWDAVVEMLDDPVGSELNVVHALADEAQSLLRRALPYLDRDELPEESVVNEHLRKLDDARTFSDGMAQFSYHLACLMPASPRHPPQSLLTIDSTCQRLLMQVDILQRFLQEHPPAPATQSSSS